jgi:uncharacterized glyoxalase superfamily protein PhnB
LALSRAAYCQEHQLSRVCFWIDELFHELDAQGVVHPNAPLQNKPWGSREFGILDEDGNLITFAERVHA